jgi:fatty acyl-CoA reductase
MVKYFGEQDWLFHDTNMQSLLEQLTPEDRDIFYFDMKNLNWASYLERCVKGVRQYILRDDPSTLPKARKRYKM